MLLFYASEKFILDGCDLDSYVDEFEYRYNTKHLECADRFSVDTPIIRTEFVQI